MNLLISITVFGICILYYSSDTFVATCNESICGSVVTKCLIMELCTCASNNFTCRRQCFHCLKNLYSECCSCVKVCEEQPSEFGLNSAISYVEELSNPVPGLFQALSEEPYGQNSWTSETYQVKFDISQYSPRKTVKIQMQTNETSISSDENILVLNCTVVFKTGCTSVSKCKNICASMGASGYRWFHDGCCECVGDNCINFGLGESKCRQCSNKTEIIDNGEDTEYIYEDYSTEEYYEDL